MTTDTTVTRNLAEFVLATGWDDLTPEVRHAARRTAANAIALAAGAAGHPAVETAARTLASFAPQRTTPVLGRAVKEGVLDAPLLTGLAAHVEDFDDTHLRTVVHPGAPVVPAALAAAHQVGASGAEVLAAVAVGVETALRVGNGICPEHFDLGWHLTSTVGHLGAAAAAGRVLHLDRDQLVAALGLAATQAAGLTAALGTMTKPFHPGKAASDGVEAALLARRGFTGPVEPIVGRRGFARAASPRVDPDEMLAGLGERWELQDNAFKPYACGIVSHPVIDAAAELREKVALEQVERVEVTVHPVVLEVMGVQDPQDGLQSKFSVYHGFAVGFMDGAGGPTQFGDDRARDPRVVDLRRRVQVTTTREVAKGSAFVTLHRTDGTSEDVMIDHATGSAQRPLTDEQLRAKGALVTEGRLGPGTERFLDLAFALDDLDDLQALYTASRPETAHV